MRRLAIDPHSPPVFRANQVVANFDALHDAFATAPGDAPLLNPERWVTIW